MPKWWSAIGGDEVAMRNEMGKAYADPAKALLQHDLTELRRTVMRELARRHGDSEDDADRLCTVVAQMSWPRGRFAQFIKDTVRVLHWQAR